jgi:hypothetical protein
MDEFIAVIKDLIHLFQDLIQIEQDKLVAAQKNRISFIEDSMNKEQAAILKLRGLDKKREHCQEQLGYKGCTFREILSKVSGDEYIQLNELFEDLSEHVKLFQDINESAQSLIEIKLHKIDKAIIQSRDKKANKKQWEELV